jgi:hypothetical protein
VERSIRRSLVSFAALAAAVLAAPVRDADAADVLWNSIQVRETADGDSVTAVGRIPGAKGIRPGASLEFRCGAWSQTVPAEQVRRSASAIAWRAPRGATGLRSFSLSLKSGKFRLSASGVDVGGLFDAVPVVLDVGGRRASGLHVLGGTGSTAAWRRGDPVETVVRVRVLEVTHAQDNALITPAAQVRFDAPASASSGPVEVRDADAVVGADGLLRATISTADPSALDALDLASVVGRGRGFTAPATARVTAGDDGESEALALIERRNPDVRTLTPATAQTIDVAGGGGAPSGTLVVPAGAVTADVAGFTFTPLSFPVELPGSLPAGYRAIAGAEIAAASPVEFVAANAPAMSLARPRWADRDAVAAADLRLLARRDGAWVEVPGRGRFSAETDRIVPDPLDPARVPATGHAVWVAKDAVASKKARAPKRRVLRGRVVDRDGKPLRSQVVLTRRDAMVTDTDGEFDLESAALDDEDLEVVQAIGAVTSASRIVTGGDSGEETQPGQVVGGTEVEVVAATAAVNVFRFGRVGGSVYAAGGAGTAGGAVVTIRLASAVRGLLLDDGGTPDDAPDDAVVVPDLGDFGVTDFSWRLSLPGDAAEFPSSATGPRVLPRDVVAEAAAAGRTVREGAATLRVSYEVPALGEVGLFAGFRVTPGDAGPAVSEVQLPPAIESTAAQSVVAGADGSWSTFLRAPAGIPMTATAVLAATGETDTQIFPFASAVRQDLAFPVEAEPPVPAGLALAAWTPRASMGVARSEAASGVIRGRIYVAGGIGADGAPLASVECYDPQTDTWTAKAPLATARTRAMAAVAGGRLFVLGGFDGTQTLDSVEVYDPETDRWTAGPTMPRARETGQAAALGPDVYVFGGRAVLGATVTDGTPALDILHTGAGTWSAGPSAGRAANGGGAAFVAGQFCVRSGFYGAPTLQTFDPATGLWLDAPETDMLAASNYAPAVCGGDRELLIVGGHATDVNAKVYDPTLEAYGHLPAPATPRTFGSAASVHGIVYSFGGIVSGAASASMEALRPASRRRADMPTARHLAAAAAWRGRVFVAGGNDGDASVDVLEVYDPERDFWFRKASMTSPREAMGMVELDGLLYCIGGRRVPGETHLSTVEVYDPVRDVWTPRAPVPRPRALPIVAAIDGLIYAAAGDDDNLWRYDPAADSWTRLESMRSSRKTGAGAAANGQLFAISGWTAGLTSVPTEVTEGYDPATNRWTLRASIPRGREFHAAVNVDERIWVVQGKYQQWPFFAVRYVTVYDPVANAWTDAAPLPRAANSPAAAVVGDSVYVVGGRTEPGHGEHYHIREQELRTVQVMQTR